MDWLKGKSWPDTMFFSKDMEKNNAKFPLNQSIKDPYPSSILVEIQLQKLKSGFWHFRIASFSWTKS